MNTQQHDVPLDTPQGNEDPESGLRKAAILVASLDRATADAMLEALDPEEEQLVRRMMVELDQVDPKQQRRVIDEFFRSGPKGAKEGSSGIFGEDAMGGLPALAEPSKDKGGQAAHGTPIDRISRSSRKTPKKCPPAGQPFCFLREADDDGLARLLTHERPQTIALVLSHLSSQRAGNVLARLEGPLQVEVVHRLIDLEETDPEILREVESVLEKRLSNQVFMGRRRTAGVAAINGILAACNGAVKMQILDNLLDSDPALAESLGPPRIEFQDLSRMSEGALGTIFAEVDPELMMIALIGAPPELIGRISRRLTAAESEILHRKLDHPGPIRISDVEEARRQVAELARRLAVAGQLELPDRESMFCGSA